MDVVAVPAWASADPASRPRCGSGSDDMRRRLARARARLEAAVPYSPDWDAAMAEIDDLERLLAAAEPRDAALAPNPDATAAA